MTQRRFVRYGVIAALVTLSLGGCASYSVTVRDMERELASRNPAAALRLLENQSTFQRDEVLYQLNKGMLLRRQGDYSASNQAFETAKIEIEKRDAISVTEQAGTLILNEGLKSFIGEDFERALLHFYAALNYLQLGKPYEARVEALQTDLFLESLAKSKPDDPRSYTEDALSRYLAGMIYENLEEWSDALISYRKAYEAYKKYEATYGIAVPAPLQADLLRLTAQQGLTGEHDQYAKQFNLPNWRRFDEWKNEGEIVVFYHNGLAPVKQSRVARFPALYSGQLISVALPQYERRFNPVQKVLFNVEARTVVAPLVENIEGIAIRSLDERLPGLTAKAIARASSKYNITKRSQQQGGDLVGLVVNIAGALTEVADTRTWFSLPSQIYMARIAVPPGNYTVSLSLVGRGEAVLEDRRFGTVAVKRGQKTFLEHHWISPQSILK